MVNKCGIYKIKNIITHDSYIGSAVNIRNRWYHHHLELSKNIHDNPHFQNAWNKYGVDNFEFSIIEFCEKEALIEREQWYIDTENHAYNICPIAGSCLGRLASEETRHKLSEIHTGKHFSEEHKHKISEANKGKHYHTEEIKNKIIKAHKGIPLSKEHKHKLREAWKTRPHMSEETKRKLSESVTNYWRQRKCSTFAEDD